MNQASVPAGLSTTVRRVLDEVSQRLELGLRAGAGGLDRTVASPRVQKLGLAFAGFLDYLHPERIQLVGRTEIQYLGTLSPETALTRFQNILKQNVCCIVVTTGLDLPPRFLDLAEQYSVAVLSTPAVSSIGVAAITGFLDEELAPKVRIHGVLVDVLGCGVLLRGESGIGKSECALDLIRRGHRLVSDDLVVLSRLRQALVGCGPAPGLHLMEIRGLGILNVRELFGVSAVIDSMELSLVVDLVPWRTGEDIERLQFDRESETLLDLQVPRIRVPVTAGRNLATLVEMAVKLSQLGERSRTNWEEFFNSLRDQG